MDNYLKVLGAGRGQEEGGNKLCPKTDLGANSAIISPLCDSKQPTEVHL